MTEEQITRASKIENIETVSDYMKFASETANKLGSVVHDQAHFCLGIGSEYHEFMNAPADSDELVKEFGDFVWFAVMNMISIYSRDQHRNANIMWSQSIENFETPEEFALNPDYTLEKWIDDVLTLTKAEFAYGQDRLDDQFSAVDKTIPILFRTAEERNLNMKDIMVKNLLKLNKRYSSGSFSEEDARARKDGDTKETN